MEDKEKIRRRSEPAKANEGNAPCWRVRRRGVTMLQNGPISEHELTWEQKFFEAENQLAKFRAQAGRVRELLNLKLKDFEEKVIEADANKKELEDKIAKLEGQVKDKDEAISALREKLTATREKSVKEAAVWEERDKKIKEWVKTKFTELLKQIEELKAEKQVLEETLTKRNEDGERSSVSRPAEPEEGIYTEIFDQILADLRRPTSPVIGRSKFDYVYERPQSPWDDGIPPKPLSQEKSASRNGRDSTSNSPSQSPVLCKSKIPVRFSSPGSKRRSPPKKKQSGLPSLNFDLADDVFASTVEENKRSRIPGIRGGPKRSISETEDSRDKAEETDDTSGGPKYFTLMECIYGLQGLGCDEEETEPRVPVYATQQGVASQIRDTPFSGESTDSEADIDQRSGARRGTAMLIKSASDSDKEVPKEKPKTCANFTSRNMMTEVLDKASYLTKLGGRIKNWKRRWFVLVDGKISYYKSQNDMNRKPLGQLVLDNVIDVVRSGKLNTFEMILATRTYYMTADTAEDCDDWIRVLKANLRRFAGARLLCKTGEKTIHKGWITKVSGPISRHCFCVLTEKSMVFYRNETDEAPVNALNLREIIRVRPLVSDNNFNETSGVDDEGNCTLLIECVKERHPLYLIVATIEEMETWQKHIHGLCSNVRKDDQKTDFEVLVSKLMSIDGDLGCNLWKSNVLVHSRALLTEPLTTLSTEELRRDAMKLFKSIQLYSTTRINESGVDYHVALAQDTLQLCFIHAELQTEIYCQLIKQTTKYRHKQGFNVFQSFMGSQSDWVTDGYRVDQTIDMSPVPEHVYVQCWQLLALCTGLFLPKLEILWLLKLHLSRNQNENTELGRYSLYCQRNLERTIRNGDREARPSRLEVLSTVLRNPYYQPLPMSIAVHFVNGTHRAFSFDCSTTVAEFCNNINAELDMRDCSQSGYALFTDNPIAPIEHCLQFDLKLCDVIGKWEQAMKHLRQGKVEKQKVIKLIYKCRLHFKSLARGQTDKEKLLLVYQVNDNIMAGHLLPSLDNACNLAGLLAQIEYGNCADNVNNMDEAMKKFCPGRLYGEDSSHSKRQVYKLIADFWSTHRLKPICDCVSTYLSNAKKVPYFGAKLFEAQEKIQGAGKREDYLHVWLVIEEEKITVLTYQDRDIRAQFFYTCIETFGGYKDDLMLVIQDMEDAEKTERRLFAMPHAKVLESTFLIASYINAVVTRRGLNLEVRRNVIGGETAPKGKGKTSAIQLWDMESSR